MSENRPADDLIGKQLGQYQIVEEVGRGGMATVYRAVQQSINRTVAVKVLPRHFLHDPGFLERFKREVDVIAHLEHPHILPIYDYGEAEGVPYIAMRFLAGGSMAQLIRRGLPALTALDRPFMQVAQALDHAHAQGIIHRDLKPGNVMLDERGNAYLTDFGIAKVINSNLTGSAIIGTPSYMSPEQANGFQIDHRSDIYTLGIVLFELITGREPFEAETPMGMLLKHINEPMPFISEFRPGLPDALEDVMARATAKHPDDRYSSATEFAADFSTVVALVAADEAPTVPPGSLTPPRVTPLPGRTTPVPPRQTPPPARQTPPPTPVRVGTRPNAAPANDPTMLGVETALDTGDAARISGRSRTPLVIGALGLAVAAVVAAAVFVVSLMQPPVPTFPPLPTPTLFPQGRTVEAQGYAVHIPAAWATRDESDDDVDRTLWQPVERDAYVRLSMIETSLDDADDLPDEMRQYEDGVLAASSAWAQLSEIESESAPDGTVRVSYRVLPGDALAPGQLDVFYVPRPPFLAVFEMYTADTTGNDLVPLMQQVLDSLTVRPDAV